MNTKLKGYRVMAGYTQEDIAIELKVSRQSYNMKENGVNTFTQKERNLVFEILMKKIPSLTMEELFPIDEG